MVVSLYFGVERIMLSITGITRINRVLYELKFTENSCTSIKHSTRLIDGQKVRFTGGGHRSKDIT